MLGFSGIAQRFFGSSNERKLRPCKKRVPEINALEAEVQGHDRRRAARRMTPAFKERLAKGETLDDLLPEAFAVVREAAKRTLGQRHFDVQLVGGMVLHGGNIAEMKTGEGKTLVATLPVYLNALAGEGVHVVTVNDYLAKRDAEWMGQVYRFLGLTVGCIVHGLTDEQRTRRLRRRRHLRHQQRIRLRLSARQHEVLASTRWSSAAIHFAIVDEVDSILVDEARTPLIISGPTDDQTEVYRTVDALIPRLTRRARRSRQGRQDRVQDKGDYELDEKQRTVTLTEAGNEHMVELLREARPAADRRSLRHREHQHGPSRQSGAEGPHAVPEGPRLHRQGRQGHHHRRIHRPHDGRPPLSEGLHQALEAKEDVDDPAGERHARLDHLPELFPPLRQAGGHDRHGADRSRRVHGHLQARRHRSADQPAGRRATMPTTRSIAPSTRRTTRSSS